jgi:hypothetical protein
MLTSKQNEPTGGRPSARCFVRRTIPLIQVNDASLCSQPQSLFGVAAWPAIDRELDGALVVT